MVITSQQSHPRTRPGLLLAILSGAPFLAGVDLFAVNVAFDDIGASFPGHSTADLSWILSAYAIVYAALLIPLGRWADKVGHKRVFLLGVGLFALASAAAALSPGLWTLVAFRVLQAVGAAALTPTSLALLITAVEPAKRAVHVRIWTAVGGAAAAFGPVVGGLLVELSWHWVFIINVPIGAVLLLLTARKVHDAGPSDPAAELDLTGAALLTVGIGTLSLALVQGQDWGWGSAAVLGSFAVAAATLIAFAISNSRRRAPMISPALLRVRSFAWSNATMLLFSASFGAGLLGGILWLQNVWGYSPLQTGLAVATGPLLVPVFAIVGQKLSDRFSAGAIAATGNLLWAGGAALILLSVGAEPNFATEFLPGWLLGGVGVGLTLPTILAAGTAALPAEQSSTGSAIVNMNRQVGTAVGISVLVALLGAPATYEAAHEGFTRSWWAVVVIALVAAVAALGLSPTREREAAA